MKSIVGTLIGDRYFIVRELRREPLGALYLACDRHSLENSQCQIERLYFPSQNNTANWQFWQNLTKLFQTEALALKNLGQNLQIPQLLDYFVEEREFYLVTELCTGKTLEQHLTDKPLNELEAIFWLQSSLEVLKFIHQKQILHLNIRPENLIQLQSDKQITLSNFGTIRNSLELFYRQQPSPLVRQSYDDYVSIEQREGSPNYSSDLYALGKTIVYALTGEVPKLQNVDRANYQKPLLAEISNRTRVNISYKLNRILSKMIDENSAARYQSAAEAIAELKQEENTVALPLPFTLPPREKKISARNKPTKSKLKADRKIKFGALLLLPFAVALIILFIGFNRNIYRNFSSYVNSNYYLAIKYPPNWTIQESEDPITGEIVVFTSPLKQPSDPFRESVYISVEYLSFNSVSLDEYLQTTIQRLEQEGNKLEGAPERTMLANYQARTIVYSRQENGLQLKQKETFAAIDNRIYIVTYVAEATQYDEYLKTTQKMLESLDIELPFYN